MNLFKTFATVCFCLSIVVFGCRDNQLQVENNGFDNPFVVFSGTNKCWQVSFKANQTNSSLQRNTGASIFGKTHAQIIWTNILVVSSSDVGIFAIGPNKSGGIVQTDCVEVSDGTNTFWLLQANVGPDGVSYGKATIIQKQNSEFIGPIEAIGCFSKRENPTTFIVDVLHRNATDSE